MNKVEIIVLMSLGYLEKVYVVKWIQLNLREAIETLRGRGYRLNLPRENH